MAYPSLVSALYLSRFVNNSVEHQSTVFQLEYPETIPLAPFSHGANVHEVDAKAYRHSEVASPLFIELLLH